MTEPLTPAIGDTVPLGSFLANVHMFGVVSDIDTPDMMSFSIEGTAGNAVMMVRALMGPPGPAGQNAPILKLQQPIYDDDDDLPSNLTDDDVDVGKFWIVREFDEFGNAVSSKAWVWYGTHFEPFPMGTQGPVGPVPIINFSFELLDPDDDDLENEVIQTGDPYHPSVHLKLKAPRGPQGPATSIANAPDVDMTNPPETGDTLVFNEATNKWKPGSTFAYIPKFWTMPEAAFVNVPLAISTSVPLGSFVVPPLEWDCVPYVQGHVRITGVELDADPLIIGVQVRLGHPTSGIVVARGFGNISTYVDIKPHFSTTGAPNDATSPENERGKIVAGSTGAAATLYVSAFNDGATGIYHFEKRGAQLSILAIPI
ncbi:bacteriophage minor tail subunit [Mycolicibacterium litorale]|uniref:Bacteriophage minor tail subunit n=1 Tax=Mycolicibacterium litorale TaxID=758802 RepID=A0A6S6P4Z1_9MYCO|nr:phage tail protein [Mycolicibacterium litorale]BCI54933.1 bacteriophage minor tail subunit [Mycolicibacterium litorale]